MTKEQINIAQGSVEATGLSWRLQADQRVTSHDLRAIASLLTEAAHRLENDPDRWLDRWMAL